MSDIDLKDPRTALLLGLADDELVTGHRHSHWTGVAPGLEEDLAFSTIAQDEINHADVWYQVLVGTDRAKVDAVGLGRAPDEYRHATLCEHPPGDFAYTLVRQWLYDHFDAVRLNVLMDSSDSDIAAVSRKLLHEERYHLEHADLWMRRMTGGSDESRGHVRSGLERTFGEALWLLEPPEGEEALVEGGVLPVPTATIGERWLEIIVPTLDAFDLADVLPEPLTTSEKSWTLEGGFFADGGGRRGKHTPDFTDDVWPEMTYLHRAFPGATW